MRIRRQIHQLLTLILVPAGLLTVAGYFGYRAEWGPRGAVELAAIESHLADRQAALDRMVAERKALEHRIALLQVGDPDIVEELARTQLMDGAPGQVAVPRAQNRK